MPRPKKKTFEEVASKDAEIACTSNDWIKSAPTWTRAPETRAEFIERIASNVVCNAQGWDTLKNGRTVATAAFNMAKELADLLGKRDKGD